LPASKNANLDSSSWKVLQTYLIL